MPLDKVREDIPRPVNKINLNSYISRFNVLKFEINNNYTRSLSESIEEIRHLGRKLEETFISYKDQNKLVELYKQLADIFNEAAKKLSTDPQKTLSSQLIQEAWYWYDKSRLIESNNRNE